MLEDGFTGVRIIRSVERLHCFNGVNKITSKKIQSVLLPDDIDGFAELGRQRDLSKNIKTEGR
jgi:hypothetical protein